MLACRVACVAGLVAVAACGPWTASSAAKTVWLCRPGLENDPCNPSLRTTRLSPAGEVLRTVNVRRSRPRSFDCFYVYPTVSDQQRLTATRAIDPELRSVAAAHAGRFSRHCRVFAPVYRQITVAGLLQPESITAAMLRRRYRDVRDAWREYLAKHNKGRGVVLLSHSQGTFVLRELIPREIEPRPRVRRRLVSALLLGGNVLVRRGRDSGGDFRRLKACRSRRQIRCVVAYSAFNAPVPEDALFGRAEAGFDELEPAVPPRTEVLCTNPASLAGGSGRAKMLYLSEPFAPGTIVGALANGVGYPRPEGAATWISLPDAYRIRCSSANGANVLQATGVPEAPTLVPQPDPTWGLHLADVDIALGNLTDLVQSQAAAFRRQSGRAPAFTGRP